ncbi:ADP-ribose pyrophosphatase, mitochondrial [Anoplophora glabripennis]|nr:ADP-ribose pyrophosphatase, mitochondrial [Anoplophora glabripennis]
MIIYLFEIIILCLYPSDYMILRRMVHTKCRGGRYLFSDVERLVFSDNQVPWSAKFVGYNPPEYNSKAILNKPWADPAIDDPSFKPKWNELDGDVNRKSHTGSYSISDGRPLNPEGRTGIRGRGVLGKWGPNHAADPIVTRWKVEDGVKQLKNSKPILQFCAIQRRDCGQWALPGGMVDPNEQVSQTLRREFLEEALNSLEASKDQSKKDEDMIKRFFQNGVVIYKGYVDDPRNTDNAWMETVAINFHDEDGKSVGKFDLKAGDDAQGVQWMDVDRNLDLYASHSNFIQTAAEKLNAHW